MNILNLTSVDFKYKDIEKYLEKHLNKGKAIDKIYVSDKQYKYLLRVIRLNTPKLSFKDDYRNNGNFYIYFNFDGNDIEIVNKDTIMIKKLAKEYISSAFGDINKEDMNIFPTLPKNIKEKTMNKLYVISSSTFETLDGAMEQINDWNDDGTLDENLRVFEITDKNKVFKTKIINLVEDKEFYDD